MEGKLYRWIVMVSVALPLLGAITATAAAPTDEEILAKVLKQCQGKFKGREPTPEELDQVLSDHEIWANAYRLNPHTPKALADPRRANLCGASLGKTNLKGRNLRDADLSGAFLGEESDLSEAYLEDADLSGAFLVKVDLSGATLRDANLSGTANLRDANLSGADLAGTNLNQAMFEPKDLPDADAIAYARNLDLMYYVGNPGALLRLRKAFKEAGFYGQERKTTYAIKHSETMQALNWGEVDAAAFFKGMFSYVFFDRTTLWGMAPRRALFILLVLIPAFAIPYVIALKRPGVNGIWLKWSDDRIRTNLGTNKPIRLRVSWRQALVLGLYFSVLSAFNIGWREVNVGNWIQRLQTNEYTLRGTGWVRTVSGIQALISVYMVAIWVLTYFGRPFE